MTIVGDLQLSLSRYFMIDMLLYLTKTEIKSLTYINQPQSQRLKNKKYDIALPKICDCVDCGHK